MFTYASYVDYNYLFSVISHCVIFVILYTYYVITYLHSTPLFKDLRYTACHYLQKKKTRSKITNSHALIGEKEFLLLLKFSFTIQRGSNAFFYFHFIFHFISILSSINEMKSLKTNIVLLLLLLLLLQITPLVRREVKSHYLGYTYCRIPILELIPKRGRLPAANKQMTHVLTMGRTGR